MRRFRNAWSFLALARQGKDLEEGAVEGQEIQTDQGISGFDVIVEGDVQQRAELIVAVVGKPVSVRDQDRQEVKQQLVMAEIRPEAIAEKAMLDGGKTSLDGSNPLGTEQLFLNHDRSPFGEKANTAQGFDPIESSFAIPSENTNRLE
jgi:hypothetical protein